MSSWGLSAAVLFFLTWFNAPPQTLGEAARREALRRQILPPAAHVLTTDNLPPPRPGDFDAPPAAPASTSTPDASGKAPADAAKPSDAHDEKWWHEHMSAARDTVTHDQMAVEALQSEVSALTRDFVNRDDPAQKAQLEQQRIRTLSELDRMKTQLVDDQKAIDDLVAQARRDGVPAGWIR
jgi:hypothetical protein